MGNQGSPGATGPSQQQTSLNTSGATVGPTEFFGDGVAATQTAIEQVFGIGGHITALWCAIDTPQNTATLTFTLNDKGSSTGATVSFAGSTLLSSDTGLNIAFSPGDVFDVAVTSGGGSPTATHGSCSVIFGP
jgi:hypothetical protein